MKKEQTNFINIKWATIVFSIYFVSTCKSYFTRLVQVVVVAGRQYFSLKQPLSPAVVRKRLAETIFKIEKELSMKTPQSNTFALFIYRPAAKKPHNTEISFDWGPLFAVLNVSPYMCKSSFINCCWIWSKIWVITLSRKHHCVTRAPLLLLRSWVLIALSFKFCEWVRDRWHLTRSLLCSIY